jgi:cyclase
MPKSNRLIAHLTVLNGELVKTLGYKSYIYHGDVLNAVDILSDFQVEEIMITDISSYKSSCFSIDFNLVERLSRHSKVPLIYGGGIENIEDVRRIISEGVERVAVNRGQYEDARLISEIISIFGSQAVIPVLDLTWSNDGNRSHLELIDQMQNLIGKRCDKLQALGAVEILLNFPQLDGKRVHKNISELTKKIRALSDMKVILNCGFSFDDYRTIVRHGILDFSLCGSTMFSLINDTHLHKLIHAPANEYF